MTSTYLKFLLLITLLSIFNACEDDDLRTSCGPIAVITDDLTTRPTDSYSISAVSFEGMCLSIEIGAGGCDGESWSAELLAAQALILPYPPQVNLKLILDDDEMCEAFIQKTYQFDLSSLNEIGDRLILRLDGWDELIEFPQIDISNIQGTWNLVNISGGLMGANDHFQTGEVVWTFDTDQVEVQNNNQDDLKQDSFESGTYPYRLLKNQSTTYWQLEVNSMGLGRITFLSDSVLTVDQREVDGFQYIFKK